MRKPTTKKRLQELAIFVAVVESQQEDHPGYGMDELNSAINSELRLMGLKEEPLEYFMEVEQQ